MEAAAAARHSNEEQGQNEGLYGGEAALNIAGWNKEAEDYYASGRIVTGT